MDELPGAGEILFSNDFTLGQAAVTWCYRDVRVVTELSTKPVPFNLPQAHKSKHTDEKMPVRVDERRCAVPTAAGAD